MSRRRLIRTSLLAGIAAALLVVAGALAVTTPVVVKGSRNSSLKTTVLVNGGGFTLYHLTAEKGGKIACTGSCATMWPPLVLPAGGKTTAAGGITAGKVGSIKRPDGHQQVTYAGLPLYRYSLDKKPGQANGEGVSGVWFAVAPSGKVVPASSTGTTATGSGSGSTTSTGSGGYGGYGG